MAAAKMRWGDTLDDDDMGNSLPQGSIIGPDSRGVTTIIEYTRNEKGETVKRTTRMRKLKVEKKTYQCASERRQWARFGEAVKEQLGDSVTVRGHEEIPLESVDRMKQTTEEKKEQADLNTMMRASADKSAITGSLRDMLTRKRLERQLAQARGELVVERPPDEDDAPGGSMAPAGSKPGGYVPPSLRNRAPGTTGGDTGGGYQRREENSVRVTNLSEDTREDDLRELFSPFGPISRIYIAIDRDTGENRGFAFINFVHRDDAQRAIDKLDGFGYDNLILRVEWAQPRAERA